METPIRTRQVPIQCAAASAEGKPVILTAPVTFPTEQGMDVLQGKVTFNGESDGLATVFNCDFLDEPAFRKAMRDSARDRKVPPPWRVHVVLWCAQRALQLSGDFVECGVYAGTAARALVSYTDFGRFTERCLYLLDTWFGTPAEDVQTDVSAPKMFAKSYESDVYDEVAAAFRHLPNVVLVRGRIPETLARVPAERVAFLSLDLDVSSPTAAAVDYFWDRLVPGAPVLFGGGNYASLPALRDLSRMISRRLGVPMLPLPTGQGLILKP
jgi:hypothetical protein